jgi:hypothetical protein
VGDGSEEVFQAEEQHFWRFRDVGEHGISRLLKEKSSVGQES